jgi:hypothetical protein
MVESLLEHETVEADEVQAILDGKPYPRPPGSTEGTQAASSPATPEPEARAEKPKRIPNVWPEPA